MGKAVGGGVYTVENVMAQKNSKSGDVTIQSTKVDLHSVEFSGHMNQALWDKLRQELLDLEQKYQNLGAHNFNVSLQHRHSK